MENKKQAVTLLCCLPGTGASTAVKLFHNDRDACVTQYNPTIDEVDNVEDFIVGLKMHIDKVSMDPRMKFVLITHKPTIRAALDEAGLKYKLLVPNSGSVEFYQKAVLGHKARDAASLMKQQFMATRFVTLCQKYNDEIATGLIPGEVFITIGDPFHAEFITDIISRYISNGSGIPVNMDLAGELGETMDKRMSAYVIHQIDLETCVATLDSHGRAIIRSADPIADLDPDGSQPDGLCRYADALGISPVDAVNTAYRGTGVDFITIPKEDAAVIIRLLRKAVEAAGGDTAKAFGDDGISYERLADRMMNVLYSTYTIRAKMAGLK